MPTKTDIEACLGAYGRCFEEQQWDQFGLAPFATGSGNALIGILYKKWRRSSTRVCALKQI